MGEPKAQRCSECGDFVAGKPNLYLGGTGGTGRLRLCVVCVTRFQSQAGVPSRLSDFIRWYRDKQGPASQVAQLKERVEELEALLDELTTPDGEVP
jgi:hypothetical protein